MLARAWSLARFDRDNLVVGLHVAQRKSHQRPLVQLTSRYEHPHADV